MFAGCIKEISWILFLGKAVTVWKNALKKYISLHTSKYYAKKSLSMCFCKNSPPFGKICQFPLDLLPPSSGFFWSFLSTHVLSLFTRDLSCSLVLCFCPICSQTFFIQDLLLASSGVSIITFSLHHVFFIAFYSVCFQPCPLFTCSQEQNWVRAQWLRCCNLSRRWWYHLFLEIMVETQRFWFMLRQDVIDGCSWQSGSQWFGVPVDTEEQNAGYDEV